MHKWKIIEIQDRNVKVLKTLHEKLSREKDNIRPYIFRISARRIEILVLETISEYVYELIRQAGVDAHVRDPINRSDCYGFKEIIHLLRMERFYEAHICSEELEKVDKDTGVCLALYSALLVKITEKSRIGTIDLYHKLLDRNCSSIINHECVENIVSELIKGDKLLSGERALECISRQSHK